MTHGQGLFSPRAKLKSEESKSGRVESSTMVHPLVEIKPGSIVTSDGSPRVSSRVRVVPNKFPASAVPGRQMIGWPFNVSFTDKLSGMNLPSVADAGM